MECSTISNCDDFGTVLFKKHVKARKFHKCGECRLTISRDEPYLPEKMLFDGSVQSQKTCRDCESLRDNFFDSWLYESLWEEMREHVFECDGDIGEARVAKLTPGAREKVCELIEEYWEQEDDDY